MMESAYAKLGSPLAFYFAFGNFENKGIELSYHAINNSAILNIKQY